MATIYTHVMDNKWKSFAWVTFFVIFVIGFCYVIGKVFNYQWLFPLAIVIALVQSLTSYWWSDKIVLGISRAKPVDKKINQDLYRLVENLSITAGLPMPKLYIINDSAPNAFATGRDPKHATLCVTSGLLDKFDKQELEGVLAHEFSHVGNYDIRFQTMIVILVGIVVLISDFSLRFTFWGGGDDNEGSNNWIALVIGLVLMLLAPLFATLIQLAISRKRELLADADGALLTRNPDGLARALEDISKDKEPLEVANKATAHLYIANPLKEHEGKSVGTFAKFFDTHPPIEERVKALREMAM